MFERVRPVHGVNASVEINTSAHGPRTTRVHGPWTWVANIDVERPARRCDISFVAGGVQVQAQDVLVPPVLRHCLTLNDTFFSHSSRPGARCTNNDPYGSIPLTLNSAPNIMQRYAPPRALHSKHNCLPKGITTLYCQLSAINLFLDCLFVCPLLLCYLPYKIDCGLPNDPP